MTLRPPAEGIRWSDAFEQGSLAGGPVSNPASIVNATIRQLSSFSELEKVLRDIRLSGDRTIRIYKETKISPKRYKLNDLSPLSLYVLRDQLEQHTKMFGGLQASYGQNLFTLTGIMQYEQNGQSFTMAPPIVEKYIDPQTGKQTAAIVDGLHRLYVARQLGFSEVWVIEITEVPPALPLIALPVSWSEVMIYDAVPPAENKRRYRYAKPQDYPDMSALTSAPITLENYQYFLYRDFSALGSSGVRKTQ